MVASRLGSAVITALSDEGTLRLAAHSNNLPQMRLLANELAALNPANAMEKRLANRAGLGLNALAAELNRFGRSEEHTSELQSLMRISYAVLCLKKKNTKK